MHTSFALVLLLAAYAQAAPLSSRDDKATKLCGDKNKWSEKAAVTLDISPSCGSQTVFYEYQKNQASAKESKVDKQPKDAQCVALIDNNALRSLFESEGGVCDQFKDGKDDGKIQAATKALKDGKNFVYVSKSLADLRTEVIKQSLGTVGEDKGSFKFEGGPESERAPKLSAVLDVLKKSKDASLSVAKQVDETFSGSKTKLTDLYSHSLEFAQQVTPTNFSQESSSTKTAENSKSSNSTSTNKQNSDGSSAASSASHAQASGSSQESEKQSEQATSPDGTKSASDSSSTTAAKNNSSSSSSSSSGKDASGASSAISSQESETASQKDTNSSSSSKVENPDGSSVSTTQDSNSSSSNSSSSSSSSSSYSSNDKREEEDED